MYVMYWTGLGGPPAFVGTYEAVFGANDALAQVIAAILFAISGGIWGAIFGVLVSDPTPLKGALFGILPTLWVWLVMPLFTGSPLFNGFTTKGLLMPLLFNVVIWGTFVGWYCDQRYGRGRLAHAV
jgi:hypothetical protein